jgi:hypothetical protein
MTRTKRILIGLTALLIASAIWLPCLHLFFVKPALDFYRPAGLSPKARELAARHLQLWMEPGLRKRELQKMRGSNAEWDFMGRSFLVWSLANMGLRDPSHQTQYLSVIDQIIEETLKLEQQEGQFFFLMPYAKGRPYLAQPVRSLFIDGEIALMLAARRTLASRPDYETLLNERLNVIVERMQRNPVLAVESYPDECWMFDHVVALAAIRIADHLDGANHGPLFKAWLDTAKTHFIHRQSGLLISSFTTTGAPLDGPEGSTIWMVAHCLQMIDESFAHDQYQRARHELGRTLLGFSFAQEWPASWKGGTDIDSGPIVPGLNISAGSSGMAFIGATAFGDDPFFQSLAATLDFAAFPSRQNGRLKYSASNQVGDAALLYATVLGPLWQTAKKQPQP